MKHRRLLRGGLLLFLITEAALFAVIIAYEFKNEYLAPVRYATVLLCGFTAFFFCFLRRRKEAVFLFIAMIFTAAADWFLVMKDENYPLAISLFAGAQLFHFVRLSVVRGKGFLWSLFVRVILSWAFLGAVFYLEAADPVILLGGLYFLELLMNTVDAGILIKKDRRFVMTMVGFFLFILCDISVGLNGLRSAWDLPREVSDLAADLIWVWYLPSQVLIVLSVFLRGNEEDYEEVEIIKKLQEK